MKRGIKATGGATLRLNRHRTKECRSYTHANSHFDGRSILNIRNHTTSMTMLQNEAGQ
jgi:hypothetical protein